MRRIIVLGGLGLFGRAAAELLRANGIATQTASRRAGADLQLDANDPTSIRSVIKPGDIVLDAAGPFHARSQALVQAAIELRFDVVDLNDNLQYAQSVAALERQIDAAGIRVLSSASTVSALTTAVVRSAAASAPRRVTSFLAPASRHTANVGTALSLLQTVGQPSQIFRDHKMTAVPGWRQTRTFPLPPPLGTIHGHVFESADAFYLPRMFPSLRDVAMYVDANTFGANAVLSIAARSRLVCSVMRTGIRVGTSVARRFGSRIGGIAYEIEDNAGHVSHLAFVAEANSYKIAVAPAVLVVQKLANDQFPERGFVLPDRYADLTEITSFLDCAGVKLMT